jgi:hypothetical protein
MGVMGVMMGCDRWSRSHLLLLLLPLHLRMVRATQIFLLIYSYPIQHSHCQEMWAFARTRSLSRHVTVMALTPHHMMPVVPLHRADSGSSQARTLERAGLARTIGVGRARE